MSAAREAIVIGAGLAGLSAATHLRAAGLDVTVLEAASEPGGLAAGTVQDGFTLDLGPTVLTEISQLTTLFGALSERTENWLALRQVEPAYQIRFAEGPTLDLSTKRRVAWESIAGFAGRADADGYLRLLDHARAMQSLAAPSFIEQDPSIRSMLGQDGLAIARAGGFRSLDRLAARYIDNRLLRRALTFQSLYIGVPPSDALGIFSMILAMDLGHGVYYPTGGMRALPQAISRMLGDRGVTFRFGARVASIRPGTRTQVRLSVDTGSHTLATDLLVIATEPAIAARLLGRTPKPVRPAPSCVVLAAGVRGSLDVQAQHTISFGHRWDEVFQDLQSGRPMRDPSFLLSVASHTSPECAPTGDSVMHLLFPAPAAPEGSRSTSASLSPDGWDRIMPSYRRHMLHTLAARGIADVQDRIVAERLITPADWSRHGLPYGTPLSAAHTLRQTGPWRRQRMITDRIALAGAGTTPGVGVPMALISGRIAAQRLLAGPE